MLSLEQQLRLKLNKAEKKERASILTHTEELCLRIVECHNGTQRRNRHGNEKIEHQHERMCHYKLCGTLHYSSEA